VAVFTELPNCLIPCINIGSSPCSFHYTHMLIRK